VYFVRLRCLADHRHRDKKVVGVFVRFRAPLQRVKHGDGYELVYNCVFSQLGLRAVSANAMEARGFK
jgi:hypothetical protein